MSYNESLSANSNYPPMSQSEWDNAPWNETELPDKDFKIDVEFFLRKKNVEVSTDDYIPEYDEEDGYVYVNTSETNWNEVYNSNHYTIIELLAELENYIKQDIERYKGSKTKERQLNEMLSDCKDWELLEQSCYESE